MSASSTTAWLGSRPVDLAVAWAWVPFFAVGVALSGEALVTYTTVVLVFSFAHQPLTLPLVYGDRSRFGEHRLLFVVAPPVMLVAVLVAGEVSLVGLAVIATTWNAIHTIRQRYGLVRMYGRKVGQRSGDHEQQLLFSAYLGVLAFAAWRGTVSEQLGSLPIGRVNRQIVATIDDLRPVALLVALVCVVVFVRALLRWTADEWARPMNRAKHHYLIGAAALCIAIPFDPVAGLLAFAGAHAAEYFVTVAEHVGPRFTRSSSRLTNLVTGRQGAWPGVLVFALAVAGAFAVARPYVPRELFAAAYLGLGGLHFLFDGFIWRSPRVVVSSPTA